MIVTNDQALAKQALLHNRGRYTKDDFPIEASTGARTSPAGHSLTPKLRTRSWRGEKVKIHFYRWPAKTCAARPCQTSAWRPERTKTPKRAHNNTPEFRDTYRQRQTVEHRLARMMQLGARQARYFGRAKTELQWLLAATVANLTHC